MKPLDLLFFSFLAIVYEFYHMTNHYPNITMIVAKLSPK